MPESTRQKEYENYELNDEEPIGTKKSKLKLGNNKVDPMYSLFFIYFKKYIYAFIFQPIFEKLLWQSTIHLLVVLLLLVCTSCIIQVSILKILGHFSVVTISINFDCFGLSSFPGVFERKNGFIKIIIKNELVSMLCQRKVLFIMEGAKEDYYY